MMIPRPGGTSRIAYRKKGKENLYPQGRGQIGRPALVLGRVEKRAARGAAIIARSQQAAAQASA